MPVNVTKAWEGHAPRVRAYTFTGRPTDHRKGKLSSCTYVITGYKYAAAERRVIKHMLKSIGSRDINIYVTCP